MSKYKELITAARKTENQKAGKPESTDNRKQKPSPPEEEDQDVNLSIKVAVSRRRHWAAEANRQGTTLTAAITSALSKRFGEPE